MKFNDFWPTEAVRYVQQADIKPANKKTKDVVIEVPKPKPNLQLDLFNQEAK